MYLNWAGEHPVLAVIMLYLVLQSLVYIVQAARGK